MFTATQNPDMKLDPKDISFLRSILLFFAFSKIGEFLANLVIDNLVGALIGYLGVFILIYGIYKLSNKYPQLNSGKKVIMLLLLSVAIDLGSAIFDFVYPVPTLSPNPTIAEVLSIASQFSTYATILFLFLVSSGVTIIASAYFFTEWFNISFGKYRPTQAYFFYGVINGVADFIIGYGIFQIGNVFKNIATSGTIQQSDLDLINSASSILNIGTFILFGAFIGGIVACFVLYGRVSDANLMRNAPPYTGYVSYPYQQPFYQQPPYQQQNNQPLPYQQFPIQQTSNPNLVQSSPQIYQQSSDKFLSNNTLPNTPPGRFCKICGTRLVPNSAYCGNCGTNVNFN